MKIDRQTFDINEELSVSIGFEDNDGLIFIPKNIKVEVKIVNYFGKIVLNNLNKSNIKVEYFEFIDLNNFSILQKKENGIKYAACIAVVISGIRLIDNIIL